MKVLVNCYACSPYQGSEPGMGWNFVKSLSQSNELHIITENKFKADLDKYFEENPEERQFYHFHFIKRTRRKLLRKIWPPSYYWTYKSWQKKVYDYVVKLDSQEHFDVFHQLNMAGYREPGFLWKLERPLVWGPIGGFDNVPWCMIPSMGLYGTLFYTAYNIINLWQKHTNRRVKTAIRKSSALLAATQGIQTSINKLYGKESVIIPEVGLNEISSVVLSQRTDSEPLKLCWSGLHIPRKSLNLLIEALSLLDQKNVELHVIGEGSCTRRWKRQAEKLNVNNIVWHGWIKRNEALDIMQKCHAFCITSLSDLTSTVTLEALSLGLPTITLDHCGFSNVITEECGFKIKIDNHKQVVSDIARAIDVLINNEEKRRHMAIAARNRSLDYSWEKKAEVINAIYAKVQNDTI